MQDGVVHLEFNDQGSPRGGREFVAPNWWMLMAQRTTSRGTIALSGMLSLDAATVGSDGYREMFQAGEVFEDSRSSIASTRTTSSCRPRPHGARDVGFDRPVNHRRGIRFTRARPGGVHASCVGVRQPDGAAHPPPLRRDARLVRRRDRGVSRGRWTVEGSVFNGREPDEHRWDFDFGPLDSVSGRVWFKPNAEWAFQVSTGHLVEPEQSSQATSSARRPPRRGRAPADPTCRPSRPATAGTTPAMAIARPCSSKAPVIPDNTRSYSRLEVVQPEFAATAVRSPRLPSAASQRVAGSGLEGGIGGGVTFHFPAAELEPDYGPHPVSFQIFFRLRRAAPIMKMP